VDLLLLRWPLVRKLMMRHLAVLKCKSVHLSYLSGFRHSKISGVSDFLAENELHALKLAREVVYNLNYKKQGTLPKEHFERIEEPFYDIGTSKLHNI
jgi:hypothetical protein